MAAANPGPDELRRILQGARRIAVVGMSKNPEKDAHTVPRYMLEHGYDVVPVNPTAPEILGRTCYPTLRAVPGPVDMVNVFRPSEDVPPIVDEAIAIRARVVWTQLGIRDEAAAEKARKAGLVVVQDRCLRVDHGMLLGRRA